MTKSEAVVEFAFCLGLISGMLMTLAGLWWLALLLGLILFYRSVLMERVDDET